MIFKNHDIIDTLPAMIILKEHRASLTTQLIKVQNEIYKLTEAFNAEKVCNKETRKTDEK